MRALLLVACLLVLCAWPMVNLGGGEGVQFVTVAASDVSSLESDFPYVYAEPEVDTSGWSVYDVTCECDPTDSPCAVDEAGSCIGGGNPASGTAAFPVSWSCDTLTNSAGTNNTTNFRCQWLAASDNTILYFPAGTYDFDTAGENNAVIRPGDTEDYRGVRGAGMDSTFIRSTSIHDGTNDTVTFIDTSDDNTHGTARSWNGGSGASRGATTISLADTSGFTEGGWVVLRANRLTIQPTVDLLMRAKVSAISTNVSITIDRPLVDDFTGGSATAQPWNPTTNLVFESASFGFEYPAHQGVNNWVFKLQDLVESHIIDSELYGYQRAVTYSNAARVLLARNEIHLEFDKTFNTYAVDGDTSTHMSFIDNYWYNAPQGHACGNGDQGIYSAFNHYAQPDANADFDYPCTGNGGDGGNNDCTILSATLTAHTSLHGVTINPDAYFHCSTSTYADAKGWSGTSGCQGTRSPLNSGSVQLHGPSCSNSAWVRNYFEGGVWLGWQDGPGRNQLFFGNVFIDGGATTVGGGVDDGGGLGAKDEYQGDGDGYTAGHRYNPLYIGNNLDRLGGGGLEAFDAGMDEAHIWYNVIRTACEYDGDATPITAIDNACLDVTLGTTSPDIVANHTIDWQNNDVGVTNLTTSPTLPSAPGMTEDPGLGGSTSFPYVGADMGVNGVGSGCLPAYERFNGSC